jgi:GNAT superfamily N-acetyltransferase
MTAGGSRPRTPADPWPVSDGTLVCEGARLDDPAVSALTSASISEIDAQYGGEPGAGAPPRAEDFLPPDGLFLVARLDGRAAGCGGFSRFDSATAELRRMYVVPQARGLGVGKALLAWLVEAAGEAGYRRIRLETGNRQEEALALYRSAGFAPIPCWGPYGSDPKSRCFERDISRRRAAPSTPESKPSP